MEKTHHIAFYKFVSLEDLTDLKLRFKVFCQEKHILGTILLASEGINGMLAGTAEALNSFIEFLNADARFRNMEFKWTQTDVMPFGRLFIKIKKEILAFGKEGIDPSKDTGFYLEPHQVDEWFQAKAKGEMEFIVLDTRNDYEVEMGTFQEAIDPKIKNFRSFPDKVDELAPQLKGKKVLTFCTGGIRCEKATAYLKKIGIEQVYQIRGGILNYLAQTKGEHWQGTCFVFDNRVTLRKDLNRDEEACFSTF